MGHWKLFTEFARKELGVGGPDAQLALVAHYVKDHTRIQQVWMAGIYCAHHTGASAYAVFREFPTPHEVARGQQRLRRWLEQHWDALPLRREMRSHRMLEKRVECLRSFAAYTLSREWKQGAYDDVWNSSIASAKYFGRYMALKYLELLRMTVRPELELRDLRAKDSWSPRIALAYLYRKHEAVLMNRHDNSPETIALVERLAAKLHHRLHDEYRLTLNFFQLQVLLCNYKQTTLGRFYPGMGLDEELEYMDQAKSITSMTPLFRLRRRLYQRKHLGELNGWRNIRADQLSIWKAKGAEVL
jgi:hypothetical protein